MKNKYYTPDLEEFHPGFEYEQREYSGTRWIRKEMGWQGVKKIKSYNEQGLIRVKHLDWPDIDSFNWVAGHKGIPVDDLLGWEEFFSPCGTYKMILGSNHHALIEKLSSLSEKGGTLSSGIIKNKSEFKRVLVQTGILKPKS